MEATYMEEMKNLSEIRENIHEAIKNHDCEYTDTSDLWEYSQQIEAQMNRLVEENNLLHGKNND